MTGVTPPPPVTPPGTGGPGTGTVAQPSAPPPQPVGEVTIEQLPQRLTQLARPVVLTGMPTGETTDGMVRLRTPMGEILLRTPVPLPADRPVMLQIPPGNPPTRAQAFVTVPGHSTQVQVPPTPAAAAPETGPEGLRSGQPALPPPAVRPGTVVAATIVAAASPARPQALSERQPVGTQTHGAVPPTVTRAAPGAAASAAAAYGAQGAVPPPAPTAGRAASPGPLPSGLAPAGAALPPGPAPMQPLARGQAFPATGPASLPPAAPPAGPPSPAAPVPVPAPPTPGPAPATGLPTPVGTMPAPAGPAPAATPPGQTVQPRAATVPDPARPPPGDPQPLPAAALRQGAAVDLHVLRLPNAPPGTAGSPSAQASAPPPPGASLQAVVTGSAPGGQTVLASAGGPLVIQARVPLAPGTVVAVSLPVVPASVAFDPLHGGEWPHLRRALDALAQADPGGARIFASTILPQAGPRLASAIAHFTGTVRQGGDARRWIGERAAQMLEATDRKALSSLDDDFRSLARQASEPLPGDWRAYSLPFSDGQAITRIQLFVRRSEEDESEGPERAGGKARRFLIDVELSALGRMQFDGLVRDRRFDLILRTRAPLPDEIRQDIQRLFTVTLDALGLTGSASFQGGGEGWVTVPPPTGSPSGPGGGRGTGRRGLVA